MMRSAREEVSAWASVLATTKSTPESPDTIMLLTALPPAPPTPHTMMRGLSSLSSGAFKLIDMTTSSGWAPADAGVTDVLRAFRVPAGGTRNLLETFLEPAPDPGRVPFPLVGLPRGVARGFEVFETGHLRVDHQADRRRERRALARFRQALDSERPADAGLARNDRAHQLRQTRQLTGAAGHHQPAPDMGGVAGGLQPVAHELEDLFDAWPDDPDELGLRQMGWMVHVVAEPVNGDRLAVVGGRGDAGAVERLQPLGVGHRHVEAARDVAGDVDAADGDRVDMDQPSAGEHADRGRAAAEIDHRRAELGLVVDQGRQSRGIGGRNHRLDPEMAALDHEHEIARRRQLAGGDVQVDA